MRATLSVPSCSVIRTKQSTSAQRRWLRTELGMHFTKLISPSLTVYCSLSDNTIPCKTSEVPMILEDPGVEFIFRYRPLRICLPLLLFQQGWSSIPKGVLKAQGIVPSESTPEMHDKPLEPKRKLSSSSETQAAQPSSTISRETVTGSSEVIKEESYESEEAAIDTRIKALQVRACTSNHDSVCWSQLI